MKIAHISDVHIRFGSRHDEYRQVFKRLYKDLTEQKPDRITITGDVNQQKINMSPGSMALLSEFLVNLVKVAPVDIIMGNHDLNEQQLAQGDTITPFFDISNKITGLQGTKKKMAHIVSKNNKDGLDLSEKGIYYYPESGFYDVGEEVVYGVYSIRDGEILTLKKKDKNKKYIAMFHGQVYGARMDNGYEVMGDDKIQPTVFNNFDIVMLGDIHEHQAFRDDESMAYAGSLIQQDYGESIDKGYLMWDLESNSFKRKYILNDFGFAKLTISKGEVAEERLDNIKFSHNKKKTKVYVVWSDYEENYSLEREKQIERYVKDKYGCEIVTVLFESTERETQDNDDVEDAKNEETFLKILEKYISDERFDADEEMIKEVLDLAVDIDKELEIVEDRREKVKWDILGIELSNLFSLDKKPIYIPWEALQGIVGLFGKNYNGKSNVIKAIVWSLYQATMEDIDPHDIVNLYTDSNKAYGKTFLRINGGKYYIKREVTTKVTKKGKRENSYGVEYMKLIIEDNKEKWVPEFSDKKAMEKIEVKRLVLDAIGTADDFTKVSLKSQSGKDGYLNLAQQSKNDLVNRFAGLQFFRNRYNFGNDYFKEVKKKQKALGDKLKLEEDVVGVKDRVNLLDKDIIDAKSEKTKFDKQVEEIDTETLEKTKTLNHIDMFDGYNTQTEELVASSIESAQMLLEGYKNKQLELGEWVQNNFEKELPFDPTVTKESLERDLLSTQTTFRTQKAEYENISTWFETNQKVTIIPIDNLQAKNQVLITEISNLQNQLPIHKGEQCPTCKTITKAPNPSMEAQCSQQIKEKSGELENNTLKLTSYNNAVAHNQTYDNNQEKLLILTDSLKNLFEKRTGLEGKITQIDKSQDIVLHNQNVKSKNAELITCGANINSVNKTIEQHEQNLGKLRSNKIALAHNVSIEDEIEKLKENKKTIQLSSYNVNQQIIDKVADLRVERNNLENFENKLKEVSQAERLYKKYSIYLQAVHRDGIPAVILKRKLPIINNKIKSILSQIVDFKIELEINQKGDISEYFYFSPDKADRLSLASSSGSQKFIGAVVIQDALHYISNLIKPSFIIIDEGFGSLDDEHISGIVNILQYLKNKYKNVLIITHKNEVKDFVDSIIEVYKTTDSIPQEILDVNQYAGITKFKLPK